MLRIAILFLVSVVLIAALTGCAGGERTYEGPRKSEQEVVVLKGKGFLFNRPSITISEVNGTDFRPNADEVEILPGETTGTAHLGFNVSRGVPVFGALYDRSSIVVSGNFSFDAKAGRVYQFHAVGSPGNLSVPIKLRLVDTKTGEAVWEQVWPNK